jgi:hypothetical protein
VTAFSQTVTAFSRTVTAPGTAGSFTVQTLAGRARSAS